MKIPTSVPSKLSTGDVMAILGMTRDQVRHAVRQGHLEAHQWNGFYSRFDYFPDEVADYAGRVRITPNWSAVVPETDSTDSTDCPDADEDSLG